MNISEIIANMSLQEKIAFCTGADFWHTRELPRLAVPAIMMSDGPHGLRCQKGETDMVGVNVSLPATCFPTAVTAGATWNRELYAAEGEAIGKEALAAGVSLVLGPGCNIKRNPLGGRNFEYISEDPYQAGKMAAAFIQGQQSTSAASSLKHFAANSQEYKRMNGDSQMDERTLREIYLAAFETAVTEGHPATVMCAYNKINGEHCSDSKKLLTDILRTEWGFDGMVVTDWGALNDRIKGFRAGCDLNMPGGSDYMERAAMEAVKDGTLAETDVDASVERILRLVEKARQVKPAEADLDAHHALAREIAEQGAVLLKNEDGILPLSSSDAVLIGHMAKEIRYQGSGSSHINPTKLVNLTDAMPDAPFVACCDAQGCVSENSLQEAVKAAKAHEIAVVVAGLPDAYESEALDREHMGLPEGHNRMIEAVAAANPNTVVVLLGGSAMELPWADKVKAILYMGLPGQAGGEAMADLLTGKANPSGKLTETWPMSYSDVISGDTFGKRNVEYREGIYVGYRYYDKAEKAVRYPFGHGLSYTAFTYSDLNVDGRRVSVRITNSGAVKGAEVVQLYIAPPEGGLFRPKKELKGFARVELEPGESKTAQFTLDDRSFALWDGGWKVFGGIYTVQIGASSRDIRLSAEVEVAGEEVPTPTWQAGSWYETLSGKPDRTEWERMMGHPVAIQRSPEKGSFTMDNSCLEMKESSPIMKIQYKVTEHIIAKEFGGKKDLSDPDYRMMLVSSTDCPMRAVVINSTGMMSNALGEGLLHMANGHFLKGLKCICFPKKEQK
ncbi:MAG: glycoside hydrolase family 3 C-terminal domain-containing protein [Oscillospiraceae bacterium]|nr:glycoside hydrolase family 3 C-terminal domain-containing protein [Oscillospiraceae bacterium]